MIANLALVHEYVADIPWENNPAFAFSDDAEAYARAFGNVVEQLPTPDLKIAYNDGIWDFRPYFKNMNDTSVRILFADLPDDLVDYCKFFVLHKIMNGKGKKISTVNVRYSDFKSVILQVQRESDAKPFALITTDDLVDAINRRHVTPTSAHDLYESLYQVYYFIINNYHAELPVEIDVLKDLGIKAKKLAKQTQDEDKLPNIPEEYFEKIVNKATEVMRDKAASYNVRATACELVMLTQLGLRLGDLLALPVGCLRTTTLPKTGKSASYIHYSSRKPSKPRSPMLEFDIFATPLCVEAYNTLVRIRKQCVFSKNTDSLYVLNSAKNTRDEFPVSTARFNSLYKDLLFQYLQEEATRPWDGIGSYKYNLGRKHTPSVTIYPPDTRQYRVHLCTSLYNQGVSLVFIQKFMGHLTEFMLGYYVRPKTSFQEDIQYSERILREIVVDGITPLGGDNNGDELRARMVKLANEKNLDVHKDVDGLVDAFGDNVVMRAKTGGICIKTTLLPCKDDKRTSHVMCAYGVCPNLFHMYYMANETYFNFKQLQKTYRHAVKTGHKAVANNELQKIKDILHRKLIPQLDQMDQIIEEHSIEYVLDRYPQLHDIIASEPDIRKEAQKWLQM